MPFQINSTKLRAQFEREILPLPPVVRSRAVAGWSVQAQDKNYQNGLETGFVPNNGPGNNGPTWIPQNKDEESLLTMQDYHRPTSLCVGYVREILNRVDDMGFNPRRARVLRLAASSESSWHVDGQPDVYSVRLHIPIITNRGCFFNYENESFHMAADGNAFLVKVNRKHMIHNKSDQDRFHLVINIWDQLAKTRFHKYTP